MQVCPLEKLLTSDCVIEIHAVRWNTSEEDLAIAKHAGLKTMLVLAWLGHFRKRSCSWEIRRPQNYAFVRLKTAKQSRLLRQRERHKVQNTDLA